MVAFFDWFIHRDTLALLRLLEAADYFDPQSFNPVFRQQLDALLGPHHRQRGKATDFPTSDFRFWKLRSRSLKRAAFRPEEEEEAFQRQIVIKLPRGAGQIVQGWNPQRHGPLEQRFKRSV